VLSPQRRKRLTTVAANRSPSILCFGPRLHPSAALGVGCHGFRRAIDGRPDRRRASVAERKGEGVNVGAMANSAWCTSGV
jgi:hypothetical protein